MIELLAMSMDSIIKAIAISIVILTRAGYFTKVFGRKIRFPAT